MRGGEGGRCEMTLCFFAQRKRKAASEDSRTTSLDGEERPGEFKWQKRTVRMSLRYQRRTEMSSDGWRLQKEKKEGHHPWHLLQSAGTERKERRPWAAGGTMETAKVRLLLDKKTVKSA